MSPEVLGLGLYTPFFLKPLINVLFRFNFDPSIPEPLIIILSTSTSSSSSRFRFQIPNFQVFKLYSYICYLYSVCSLFYILFFIWYVVALRSTESIYFTTIFDIWNYSIYLKYLFTPHFKLSCCFFFLTYLLIIFFCFFFFFFFF